MFKVTARAALISTAAAVMFAAPSTVYAQQVSRAYNVPAQGLDAALKAIAAVSGEQIIYEPGSVRAKRSSAVVGNYSTDQAVTTALHGTGLSVSRSPRGVLVVTSRAAPAEQPRGEAEAGSAAAGNGDALPVDPVDQEIVVTGSHIRGAAPAGANLIVLNKKDLDQTGRGTLAEAIQTVPQVHGGGANARNLRPGPGAAPNMFGTAGGRGAASLNLRGLGVEETLTLVNGRRLAPAGSFGAIADISALPMEAVERIEILADGASATYGADAMAGVVNIIMDRRFHGAVTRLRGGIETRSGQPELQASQTIGWSSDRANILISADYAWQHGIKMKGRPYAESMDLRPMGGDDHRVSACNPGNIIYPFEMAGAIPSGQDGRTLEPDQIRHGEINRCERFPGSSHLIPETRRASVYLTGSYEVTDRLQLTGDALATKRSGRTVGPHLYTTLLVPVTNAYRQMNGFHGDTFPLDQPILIDYQFTQIEPKGDKDSASSLLGTIGATYVIGANWQLNLSGAYGRYDSEVDTLALDVRPSSAGGALNQALESTDPSTAFNPFGDANFSSQEQIEGFLFTRKDLQNSDYHAGSISLTGAWLELPGGPMKLAIGGDYRRESFRTRGRNLYRNLASRFSKDSVFKADRSVTAVYAELFLPLFSELNEQTGARNLSFSLSGRYDHYSDFGGTLNPKAGVTWEPTKGLVLKGSYGTSFKAPLLPSLYSESLADFLLLGVGEPDANGDGRTSTMFIVGGNPNLGPEKATSWTAGFVLKPEFAPGFRTYATYFNLRFTGRFADTANWPLVFSDPAAYEGIAYFPLPAQSMVEDYIGSVDRVYGMAPPAGSIEAIIDARAMNFASQVMDGIDAGVSYSWPGLGGTFNLSGNLTYLSRFKSRLGASVAVTNYLGNVGLPARWKARQGLSWDKNGLSLSAWLNYTSSYRNKLVRPHEPVSAYTTIDVVAQVPIGSWMKRTAGDDISLSFYVTNLFDEAPPFVNNPAGVGYDGTNADPVGRRIALQLTRRW